MNSIKPDVILPHALSRALDAYEGLRVLSLDCFDTLIWRDVHAPADVFATLPGTTPLQRSWAETRARKLVRASRDRNEVGISDIYAQLMGNASHDELQIAAKAELEAEARHCFAFAPTVALMREAKSREMDVVIVSDTYLDESQLRELIAQAAGADVAALIGRIFCSCTYGKSKGEGLYEQVLRKVKVRPEEVLHIGDNRAADVDGIRPFGVNVLHLDQFAVATETRLRMESAVSAMIHPLNDAKATALQPHRAALAIAEPKSADGASTFGLTVLGPVMLGFERWLQDEAAALVEKHGGKVHWLFLMRDGHLPMLVHQETGHQAPAHPVEISRFTAIASSFSSERDVQRYCELELGTNPPTLARQLLIAEDEIDAIIGDLDHAEASMALMREVRKGQRKKRIVRASRAFAERLVAHVRAQVAPEQGDVLMFVDLGYNGTVQNHVDAILAKALDVHVAGRYLLLRETDRPGLDKKGFIGIDNYDAHALEAMCANVAVLEQVCTRPSGSVVDYEEDGTPIRKANDIKGRQSAIRERIQQGCLDFVKAEVCCAVRQDFADRQSSWRQGAASVLARLMFLPLEEELAVIESFEHDVNLGTERTVALFDRDIAARGMRRRGLFYMKGSERMYLPAELVGQGLAAKLTLMAHKRFCLPFAHGDFADSTFQLPVIFADREETVMSDVQAMATHDGYYMAAVPIGDCRYSVALRFGALFEWLQIESMTFHAIDDFLGESHGAVERERAATAQFDGIEQAGLQLYRCEDESGFMMVHPPEREDGRHMVLSVVFRPLVERCAEDADAVQPTDDALTAQSGHGASIGIN